MAITTFAELKTALAAWQDRSDLADYLGDFVTLAESYLNREVRHYRMVTTTTLSPTANVCTLPSDYLHYLSVVEDTAVRRKLAYLTPDAVEMMYPTRESGVSCHFSIVGNQLTAYPLSENNIELTYRQKIQALSASNTSNWLLQAAPDIYLRAAQLMAMEFVNETNTPRYQSTAILLRQHVDALNGQSSMALHHTAGMTIAGATP